MDLEADEREAVAVAAEAAVALEDSRDFRAEAAEAEPETAVASAAAVVTHPVHFRAGMVEATAAVAAAAPKDSGVVDLRIPICPRCRHQLRG